MTDLDPSPSSPSDKASAAPVRKVPKTVRFDLEDGTEKVVSLSAKHYKMLEIYSQSLDFARACKEAGVKPHSVRRNPAVLKQIQLIRQAAMYKFCNQAALGDHERFKQKLEAEFDRTGDKRYKASLASTWANMSKTSLQASGDLMDDRAQQVGSGISVEIVIGGEREATPAITVEATEHE